MLGCACAGQPRSPFFGDERFLVVGVDPDAEADALARALESSGFRVVQRLRGQHFRALGAVDASGAAVKVRVVTARGIALALDPTLARAGQPALRYALLPPPSRETHDADGDGFEEVFVHELAEGAAPCILVYRVRDSGFVDPAVQGGFTLKVAHDAQPPWDAPNYCTEQATEPAADAGAAVAHTPDAG